MEESVTLVCGRRHIHVPAVALRELAEDYERVVADLGTGDGRWLYRLARSDPGIFCLGIDANANTMREVSYRAGRKAARGGLPNIRFIVASVEFLPAGLEAVADEVTVAYPWGSLLRMVLAPDPFILQRVAAMLKPHGVLRVAINESLLASAAVLAKFGLTLRSPQDLRAAARAGYKEAGLKVTTWRPDGERIRSSWAGRLGQGRGLRTLWVEAVRDGDGRNHGGG